MNILRYYICLLFFDIVFQALLKIEHDKFLKCRISWKIRWSFYQSYAQNVIYPELYHAKGSNETFLQCRIAVKFPSLSSAVKFFNVFKNFRNSFRHCECARSTILQQHYLFLHQFYPNLLYLRFPARSHVKNFQLLYRHY